MENSLRPLCSQLPWTKSHWGYLVTSQNMGSAFLCIDSFILPFKVDVWMVYSTHYLWFYHPSDVRSLFKTQIGFLYYSTNPKLRTWLTDAKTYSLEYSNKREDFLNLYMNIYSYVKINPELMKKTYDYRKSNEMCLWILSVHCFTVWCCYQRW